MENKSKSNFKTGGTVRIVGVRVNYILYGQNSIQPLPQDDCLFVFISRQTGKYTSSDNYNFSCYMFQPSQWT